MASLGRTAFCAAHDVRSEAEYKRRRRDAGRLTYHAHLGLSDWPATARALDEIVAGLGEHGETLDRFGLCLSRSMGLPAADRAGAAKETGPRLEPADWRAVAAAPVQPHLGDFMSARRPGWRTRSTRWPPVSPRSATSASTSPSSRRADMTTPS